jgi:glycerol-3-phosphate acyltransferase PlsY
VFFEVILIIYFSYLLGSVPSGVIFARLFSLGELNKIGSGNTGATNVLRTGNYWAAGLTLIIDFFKAYIAISICSIINADLIILSATIILLGHIFPVWIENLKGGKGYASFLGILFASNVILMFLICIIWLIIFLITRISSVSTLISANLSTLYSLFFLDLKTSFILLTLNLILIFSHQDNIKRLIKGTESKIL